MLTRPTGFTKQSNKKTSYGKGEMVKYYEIILKCVESIIFMNALPRKIIQ